MPFPDKPKIVYKIKDRTEQTITFTDYAWTQIIYEPVQIVHRTDKKGDIYVYRKGFIFRFTIHWDKLTPDDYYRLIDLFDNNIEYIKVYPKENEVYNEDCLILQPVELKDFLLIWDSFDLVFESKRRIEKIYLSNLDFWGTNKTTFADTTTRRGITGGWNTVMTEQNNKDTATNNAINTLRTNINNHLNASNPHGTLYYTKSEIDAKWKNLLFVGSTEGYFADNSFNLFKIESGIPLIISGIKGKLNKVMVKREGGTIIRSYDFSSLSYLFDPDDQIKFFISGYTDGTVVYWDIGALKNNLLWWGNSLDTGDNLKFILTVEILEQN
jgi:hypothetical protein